MVHINMACLKLDTCSVICVWMMWFAQNIKNCAKKNGTVQKIMYFKQNFGVCVHTYCSLLSFTGINTSSNNSGTSASAICTADNEVVGPHWRLHMEDDNWTLTQVFPLHYLVYAHIHIIQNVVSHTWHILYTLHGETFYCFGQCSWTMKWILQQSEIL